MIPDNVTLIVKAPNQQVEDQNVECQSSWTVRQLKGHLSEVYPSKPTTEEQKIIYSGQLLDDNTVLKDVLRTYDSQIAHTMHLVCTPTRKMPDPLPTPQPSTDGLRQRTVPSSTPADPNRPETRQNDQNHNVEMQNYLSSFANYGRVPPYPPHSAALGYLPVPGDPALLNHVAMMQQAYLQYMQQYANMWQATTTANAAATPQPPPPAGDRPEPAPAPPAPAVADDDDAHPHDWLDQLYAASRLAILFSLLYLYGSPARFLLVLLLAGAGYLHQIGFFRDLHVNAAPAAAPAADNAPPAEPQQPAADNNQANNQGNQQQAPGQPAPTNNDTQQSLLAVTWMIFTSFFASLIPEAN